MTDQFLLRGLMLIVRILLHMRRSEVPSETTWADLDTWYREAQERVKGDE